MVSTDQQRVTPRNEHGRVTSQSAGVAFVVPPLLLVPLLPDGGVAPLLVAAASALLIGAPAAVAEWRTRSEPSHAPPSAVDTGLASIAELAGILLVATTLAALARGVGWLGLVLAVLAWPLGALWMRIPRAVAVPAGIALVGAAALAVGSVVSDPPWTLLEPHWDAWPRYLGPATTAGVLLAGAGTGHWTIGPRRPPGDRHAPWAVVGMGLLLTVALAVEGGARFERTLGTPGLGWPVLGLTALGLLSTTTAIAMRAGSSRGFARSTIARLLAGVGLTALLAVPAAAVQPWIATVVVPVLAAALLAGVAMRATGTNRMAAAAAAAVLAIGAAAGWPGVPDRTSDAVWIGLLLVGGFWFVATRTLLARRSG